VLVITAGCLCNLIQAGILPHELVGLLVLDEAHHAVEGKHPFAMVADWIVKSGSAQVVGLTASPNEVEKLQRALGNAKVVQPAEFATSFERVASRAQAVIIDVTARERALLLALERLVKDLEDVVLDLNPEAVASKPQGEINTAYLCGVKYQRWARDVAADAGKDEAELRDAAWALAETSRVLALACDLGAWAGMELASVLLALRTRHAHCERALELVCGVVLEHIGPLSVSTSAKLERLRVLLRRREAGVRALVRVSTRAAALFLADALCSEGFNAAVMLGKGVGAARMGDAKRKDVLQEFKQGGVDVLVATSVMEEGHDVAECGLVVCFSLFGVLGRPTSLIQNMGRARAEQSEFYVFITANEDLTLDLLKELTVEMGEDVRKVAE